VLRLIGFRKPQTLRVNDEAVMTAFVSELNFSEKYEAELTSGTRLHAIVTKG